jgi:hypothetical protein
MPSHSCPYFDIQSRQVISSSSAEVEGGSLSALASKDADELQLFKRLRDEVTTKLADDVIAHCRKPGVTPQAVTEARRGM